MKILMAGDWHSDVHEGPAARALVKLGQEDSEFRWSRYFQAGQSWLGMMGDLGRRAQNKFLVGPRISRLNADLIAQASRERPDVVFIYLGTHILPGTLRRLRQASPGVFLAAYCNDNPFSPTQPRRLWRHLLAGLSEYDLVFAYRSQNLQDFREAGARRVGLLRSWFDPELHRPLSMDQGARTGFTCDVVFIGHYEPDQRLNYLSELARNEIDFRLYGPDWDRADPACSWLRGRRPIRPLHGTDYVRALCDAKIALCFLSSLNQDTYTRRCFEIPATGTMMMSEHSEDLETLFREGVEAEFFRNPGELLTKVRRYLEDEPLRRSVASAGLRRVHHDGHDVVSRMRQLLSEIPRRQRVSA